jgi:hypothetical protein
LVVVVVLLLLLLAPKFLKSLKLNRQEGCRERQAAWFRDCVYL